MNLSIPQRSGRIGTFGLLGMTEVNGRRGAAIILQLKKRDDAVTTYLKAQYENVIVSDEKDFLMEGKFVGMSGHKPLFRHITFTVPLNSDIRDSVLFLISLKRKLMSALNPDPQLIMGEEETDEDREAEADLARVMGDRV
jgi:hypothetical protein